MAFEKPCGTLFMHSTCRRARHEVAQRAKLRQEGGCPLESLPVASGMGEIPHPGASGIPRRPVPMSLEPPTTPQPKVPPPPMLYKEGDPFSSVLEKYSGWKGSRLTPRKRELLYYMMFYHDEKDVSKRMGIEGASEIIQESGVIREKSGL